MFQAIRRSLRRWFTLPRPTCRFRPCLEPFEDRCLPSLLLVSNLKDAGAGSLRQRIAKTNATAAADTIEFAAGLKGTIRLTSGQLEIHEDLTIRGPGAARLAVSGNNSSSVLYVAPKAKVKISNLTIRDGKENFGAGLFNDGTLLLKRIALVENSAVDAGGAVYNRGQLQITQSKLANNSADYGGAISNHPTATATIAQTTVTNNRARLGLGGGIRNSGTMSISTSTISFNKSVWGGGISSEGTLAVISSTLIGNFAWIGGAIYSAGASPSTSLINSTIVNNTSTALLGGGGIRAAAGSLTVNSCTITGNVDASGAAGSAGGISCAGGLFFTLNNSVVAENFAVVASQDVYGAVVSGSGNLIGIGTAALTGISNGMNSNQIGTAAAPRDPKLGPLENNGGPTLTRLPRPGSPLINKGVNAALPFGLATDQRGRKRIWAGIADIGAVEFGA